MNEDRVGYTHAALLEYNRNKPWTIGLDPNRCGIIRKDLLSQPGSVMVQWDDDSKPQQVASDLLEKR